MAQGRREAVRPRGPRGRGVLTPSRVPVWERSGKGDLLHREMGRAGERIWADIVGGKDISRRRYADWKGVPPVDVVREGIGFQVKTVTNPESKIHFSGRARQYRGAIEEKSPAGDPAGKLSNIEAWLGAHSLHGWLVVFLLDEDSGRAVVYAKDCVCNTRVRQMEPIGTFDNNTGEFRELPGNARSLVPPFLPWRASTKERFPYIPVRYRGRYGKELAPFPHDRTVRVRGHRRKR